MRAFAIGPFGRALVGSRALMASENTSVLVLLVATNGEPWLPEVLNGLRRQTYEPLDVLAVDNASTDRSRALLGKTFGTERVVSLDRRVGYGRALAAALKVAVERGATADAFLLLHDDAAMDPGAIEAMVEALAHDRVGLVGCKLVEWDDPDLLQEVGLTTDRYGRLFNPLERGELDQGQYDGLREVLFSSSACLLVSRDVIERVGLFDLRYVALRDDFDLCWRARVAGFRSVVTTGARVRHAVASYRDLRQGPTHGRARYFGDRNMIASLIKNYGLARLVLALPVTVFGSLANAVLFAFTGRRHAARQALEALQWNLAHLPSTLRARRRSQRARSAPDREVMKFMVRGAPRLRSYVERALEQAVGEPAEDLEEGPSLERRPRKSLWGRLRAHPVGFGILALLALYVVGARSLYGTGGLAGADLAPFPHQPAEFFREFFSGWRSAGTGGAAPASPALFLAGALSVLSFGSTWLAERVLFLALLPLAAGSAWRAAAAIGLPPPARRVSALVYALSPLTLVAFSEGRLPDLVLAAALPALLIPVLRAAGLAPAAGWRSLATGAVGLAVVSSVSPWALVAVGGSAAALAAGSALTGARRASGRPLVAASAQVAGALALLLPWSVELFRPGSPLGAGGARPGAEVTDLVRLVPHGPSPVPGAIAWALPAAAAVGFAVATRPRERAARVLAAAGALGVLVAWGVARGAPWIAPRPGLPLTLAAVCMALLVGIGAEGLVPSLSARLFGLRHVALAALTAFGAVALAGGLGFLARGDFRGIQRSGLLTPAFFIAEHRKAGDFRVLWLGGSPRRLGAALSPPGGETMLTFGSRRAGAGERYLEDALASILGGATEHAGRLLAPLGVRYVVVRPGTHPAVTRALERQSDLRFSQRFRGGRILANEAWLPVAGAIASPEWVAASGARPPDTLAAVSGAPEDPGRVAILRRTRPGRFEGRIAPTTRLVVLAEEFSPRWRAVRAPDAEVRPRRSFGWAAAFPAGGSGRTVLVWTGQRWHRLALLGQALLLVAAAVAWSRRSARERGER